MCFYTYMWGCFWFTQWDCDGLVHYLIEHKNEKKDFLNVSSTHIYVAHFSVTIALWKQLAHELILKKQMTATMPVED